MVNGHPKHPAGRRRLLGQLQQVLDVVAGGTPAAHHLLRDLLGLAGPSQ